MDPFSSLLYVGTLTYPCNILSVNISTGALGSNTYGSNNGYGFCEYLDGATPSFIKPLYKKHVEGGVLF